MQLFLDNCINKGEGTSKNKNNKAFRDYNWSNVLPSMLV